MKTPVKTRKRRKWCQLPDMNVTEQFEEMLRLARQSPHAWEPGAQRVLNVFAKRARRMREKLDARRREKIFFRLLIESQDWLHSELMALGTCETCGWDIDRLPGGICNPLSCCTGDFGCALECLRYKSCVWHPDLLKK